MWGKLVMGKKYKAFISYRHLQPDQRVAEKLQELLENYRAPHGATEKARIGTIFRDKTELPTSSDLDKSLKDALAGSEYLIVILSDRTKESRWCMEEIRTFKEAHGGRINHILPVLVAGEPMNAIPPELRSEVIMVEGHPKECVVEPLCCDVRADSWKQQRRLLKKEYLRLAAPMLGCGFDDLYRREQRRRNKRRAAVVSLAFALILLILAVIGVSYVRVRASERRYHKSLMDSYVDQAAQLSVSGDGEAALAYYARVIALDPPNRVARIGTLVELQKQGWFYADDLALSDDAAQSGAANAVASDDMAVNPEFPDAVKRFGELTQEPEQSQRGYVFMGTEKVRVWMPEKGDVYEFDRLPTIDYTGMMEDAPLVMPMFSDRVHRFVQYNGEDVVVYESNDALREDGVIPCAEIHRFPYDEWGIGGFDFIADTKVLFASPETGLLVLNDGGIIYTFDIFDPAFLGVGDMKKWIGDICFRNDGECFAVVNSEYTGGQTNHRVTLFGRDLYFQQNSAKETGFPMQSIEYRDDDRGLLWATRGNMRMLDGSSTVQTVATLPCTAVERAGFSKAGGVDVLFSNGATKHYGIARFKGRPGLVVQQEKASVPTIPRLAIVSEQHTRQEEEDYSSLTTTISWAELRDESGAVLDTCFKDRIDEFYAHNDEFDCFTHLTLAPDGQTVYCWGNKYDAIVDYYYRVRVDTTGRKLTSPEKITFPDLYRSNVLAIEAFDDGCAVTVSGGKVLFYRNEEKEPFQVIALEYEVEQECAMAVSNDGLFAAVTYYSVPEETPYLGIEVPCYDVIELWDIATGTHIANLEAGTPAQHTSIDNLCFSGDSWLCYSKHSEYPGEEDADVTIRVAADVPDTTAAIALDALACYRLGDDNALVLKTPQLAEDLGSWQSFLESIPG